MNDTFNKLCDDMEKAIYTPVFKVRFDTGEIEEVQANSEIEASILAMAEQIKKGDFRI